MKKWILGSVLFLLLWLLAVIVYVHVSSKNKEYTSMASMPSKYVAIVFGAGIRIDGTPSKYLKDRLDAGIVLYKRGLVKRILLSGDNGTHRYDELKVMKEYCSQHGVPKQDIFVDYAGFDTYSTVYRAGDLFKVDEAILVTQAYHLPRALYLAKSFGIDAIGFAADKGAYSMALKNTLREQLAISKSVFDVNIKRKPKFYGGNIDIRGVANYDKK